MGILNSFYAAFSKMDAEAMVALYHPSVVFEDPAFGKLRGEKAKNMWRMLVASQKGKDFKIIYTISHENDSTGKAHWEAFYTFGKHNVHNKIEASFEFQDGKIIKHTDNFSLYKWSQQAFGIVGFLIGWTPFFQKKLRKKVLQRLHRYEAKYV